MSATSTVLSAAPSAPAIAEARRATAHTGPDADRLDGAGEQSFSFSDFLSIINPLQHLPIVGSLYRAITGDTIKPAPKVIGGLLFGGPVGLVTSAFTAMVEQTTGKDLGEQALALLMPTRDEPSPDHAPQYAGAPASADSDVAPLTAEAPLAAAAEPHGGEAAAIPPASWGRSLGNRTRTASSAASGRTLADYWASAGRAMPVIDNTRSSSGGTSPAPVRLQTTMPLNDPARASIFPSPRGGAPGDNATARTAEANPGEPLEGFAAAMMRGLDRYREMKQAQSRPAPAVVDTAL